MQQASALGGRLSNLAGLGAGAAGVRWSGPDYQIYFEWLFYISVAWAVVSVCREAWSNRNSIGIGLKKVQPSHVIVIGLVIAMCGLIWQWRRQVVVGDVASLQTQITALQKELASTKAASAAATPAQISSPTEQTSSILVAGKFYSRQNKEDVSDILDATEKLVKGTGAEILHAAEMTINHSPWERGNTEIAAALHSLKYMIASTAGLQSGFFVEFARNKPTYETEIQSLFGSPDAIAKFRAKATDFSDALAVLAAVEDRELREGVKKLAHAARFAYADSRQEFAKWLDQVKDRIWDTKRALQK